MERNFVDNLLPKHYYFFLILQLSNKTASIGLQETCSVFSGVLSTKIRQPHTIMSPIYYLFHSTNFSQTVNPLQLLKVCKQMSESPQPPPQFKLVNVCECLKSFNQVLTSTCIRNQEPSLFKLFIFIIQPAVQ